MVFFHICNRNVSGNLNERIRAVKGEMAEVQALCPPPCYFPHLKRCEQKFRYSFRERRNIMAAGTVIRGSFMSVRRAKSRSPTNDVTGVMDELGNWCTNVDDVGQLFCSFFTTLFPQTWGARKQVKYIGFIFFPLVWFCQWVQL